MLMKRVIVIRRKIIPYLVSSLLLALPTVSLAEPIFVDQGSNWTDSDREAFYTEDQGSRIMPLAWMRALKQKDGYGFLSDGLERYGYLPNPNNGETDIPVGFTVANNEAGDPSIGMTCSACHTRQINVEGKAYRIDGGPGIVDFQSFLADLDIAVGDVLATDDAFGTFAESVLGAGASAADIDALKLAVDVWYLRYHTLIERSLPDPAWGPSRLDAVSMIFNRLTGLDMGEKPPYIIAENIALANAPTRYPFLWNAARQDKTQWPGFADNGNDILGLARNVGEVYGVFADFHPKKQDGGLFKLNRDYISHNSANFSGLQKQEEKLWKIGPPQWPWDVDQDLADLGKAIYERPTSQGGCTECHGIKKGAFRSPFHTTWATPIIDVGTDVAECKVLERTVKTGVMEGAKMPLVGDPLGETETAFKVLSYSVIGAIIQNAVRFVEDSMLMEKQLRTDQLIPEFDHLKGAFRNPDDVQANSSTTALSAEVKAPSGCAYESRVMEGIWAAAPYLHNGSVASLSDLLKPASERTASFKIGPDYDIKSVGLAIEQSKFDYTLETTDCSDLDSGSSRCGHEFGTDLAADEKLQLLEYLKTL